MSALYTHSLQHIPQPPPPFPLPHKDKDKPDIRNLAPGYAYKDKDMTDTLFAYQLTCNIKWVSRTHSLWKAPPPPLQLTAFLSFFYSLLPPVSLLTLEIYVHVWQRGNSQSRAWRRRQVSRGQVDQEIRSICLQRIISGIIKA